MPQIDDGCFRVHGRGEVAWIGSGTWQGNFKLAKRKGWREERVLIGWINNVTNMKTSQNVSPPFPTCKMLQYFGTFLVK